MHSMIESVPDDTMSNMIMTKNDDYIMYDTGSKGSIPQIHAGGIWALPF